MGRLESKFSEMCRTQTLLLEKMAEISDYLQRLSFSSSVSLVKSPPSMKAPTQASDALPHSSTISTGSLLPAKFGSHLSSWDVSRPSDAAPANRGNSSYGIDPTLSIPSTLPTDHILPGPLLPPHRQEGSIELSLEEVPSDLADEQVYIRLLRETICLPCKSEQKP